MTVRDRIEDCCERFAMTRLLASRTRLPGHEPGALERSPEHLAALHESLGHNGSAHAAGHGSEARS